MRNLSSSGSLGKTLWIGVNGNIGIGTNNPLTDLHLSGDGLQIGTVSDPDLVKRNFHIQASGPELEGAAALSLC